MCCFGNIKIDSSAIYELRKLLSAARVKGSNASVSKSAANKHNKKGFFCSTSSVGLIHRVDQLKCPSLLVTFAKSPILQHLLKALHKNNH